MRVRPHHRRRPDPAGAGPSGVAGHRAWPRVGRRPPGLPPRRTRNARASGPRMTPPIIFSGPSLPRAEVEAAGFLWRPPVRQGDVRAILDDDPAAIGIIDGMFECVPTVWHDEILEALDRGIPVYGASSIGALRAAELDVYGMIGVGEIYEAYRDGVLEDDDEVALLHAPEELGYPSLTAAMVNIRATLAEAERQRIIASDIATQLTSIAKALFYKERTYDAVLRAAREAGLPVAHLKEFSAWLPQGRIDQKRLDAEAMLAAAQAHLAADMPPLRV